MEINKNILTVEWRGVFRCCVASLNKQIKNQDIFHNTELSCKHCKRKFILTHVEAFFIPKDLKE